MKNASASEGGDGEERPRKVRKVVSMESKDKKLELLKEKIE